jgi:predicted ATP-dependent endonuclease of OLD family
MKYKKFIIESYKAIGNAQITLKNNLIPLIGINESGKTSILHAILAFHKEKDKYKYKDNEGYHLIYENRYETEKTPKPCFVKAAVVFDTLEEVNSIANELKLEHGSEPLNNLIACLENKTQLIIARDLKNKKYFVEEPIFPQEMQESLANEMYKYLPNILYFHSFDTSPDDSITFPAGYTFEKKDTTSFAEWRNLLCEVFAQATNGQYTLQEFIQIQEQDDRKDDIRRKVRQKLNEDIIKEWQDLQKEGIALSDEDFGNLQLEIKYINNQQDTNKAHDFQFKLIDTTKDSAGHGFSISKRSTGFNWFFNFIVKLKYNPDYRQQPSGAIYLLDEPGSNLHSSAQVGLLKQLQKLSERNQIIFGTHSQYLLDPEVIPINQDKIVEKKYGNVTIKNFSESGIELDQGALTPLFHALRLKIGSYNFIDKKVIITEGITDFYFLKMLLEYSDKFTNRDYSIIPGAGAGQLQNLISFAIGWAKNKYIIFLDTDDKGNEAFERYKDFFGEEEAKKFIQYNVNPIKDKFELEDFLSAIDKQKLLDITKVEKIKVALMTLYYMENEEKSKFIKGLNAETMLNLAGIIQKIIELTKCVI